MNKSELSLLDWTSQQTDRLIATIQEWAAINTGSDNLSGLGRMSHLLKRAFETLGAEVQEIALPPRTLIDTAGNPLLLPVSPLLVCTKRRKTAKRSLLLGGHMDTVYTLQSPFQSCTLLGPQILQGPGVADMKGGLALMLVALETLERSPLADQLSWEVFINPDEEVGSPSSSAAIRTLASKHDYGLLFEPLLPDGSFVSARKGSVSFSLVARGRAAHVGRDFQQGRNAVAALVPLLGELMTLNGPDLTLNLGSFTGGGAVNVVPDLAILRFGLRARSLETLQAAIAQIEALVDSFSQEGIALALHRDSYRPPKCLDAQTEQLFSGIKACAESLSLPTHWTETGGVCDGNILADAGLPTLDTLGVEGGKLHTHEEFIYLDRVAVRAQLAALILLRLAAGQLVISHH